MKRLFVVLSVLCVLGVSARAEMDSKTLTATVIGATTNTASLVLRGTLEALKVDITAGSTCTVTLASGELTLFSKAGISADTTFFPRAAMHTTAGVAATFTSVGTNDLNGVANTWYTTQPMAGLVTMTVIGQSALTNTVVATPIFSK